MRANRAATPWLDLTIFFLLAAAVRLFFWQGLGRALDSADSVHYVEMATQFANRDFHSFNPRIPVLYPLLSALARIFVHDIESACRFVSLAASALLTVPVYLLSKRMHGESSARIAALAVATWPWLADYGSRVAPESLALLLWMSSVYLLVRGMNDSYAYSGAAALGFFALNLTRPEGILVLFAAPFAALVVVVRGAPGAWKRFAWFAGASVALLAFYLLVMRSITGQAQLSYRAVTVGASAHYLSGRAVELAKTFEKVLTEVIPIMLGPLFLLFAGVGLFQTATAKRDLRVEVVLGIFVAAQLSAAILSTYPEPRYTMAAIVAITLWAARGMALISGQWREAGYPRTVCALPVTAMLALMAFGAATVFVPQWLGRIPRDPVEYKIAGEWMKRNLDPGLILTRKPQLAYYAGMPSFGPSVSATSDTVVGEATAAKARYVVVDERYTASMAPGLRPLLDAVRPAPQGLRRIKSDVSPYPEARVVIYEVVSSAPAAAPTPTS